MAHPFERLLLATEHSVYDGGAETLALALARAWALPLQAVLPVHGNPEFEAVAPQLAARADDQAAERRESLLAMARAQSLPLSVLTRHGPEVFETVVQAAREGGADLIVIRRRGRRGLLANLMVGEMVGKVVAQAPCSVLIAARGARLWQRGVLVGVHPEHPQMQAVERAAAIAAAGALPLHVLCVVEDPARHPQAEQVLAAALARARSACDDARGAVRQGRPHEVLMQHARECGDDLLVLARGASGRFWSPGTAQKVAGLAECPVLVEVAAAA